ncbi:MAG: SDR family NAD(P)-dependent oxidoreductase [Dehalococcoidia bacterium]
MQELQGRVAVVTGAASGIGRALAERFAAEGMKVVLADVEREPLARVTATLEDAGYEVLAVPADVSIAEEVDALARAAVERFGAVHVLCNNAGVAGREGRIWEASAADWEWIVGVNLLGVAHGIRAFVPLMLAQESEGHIVNTASVLGLTSGPGTAIYGATKHAVVRMSEGLHYELQQVGTRLKVSVLCPGMVATQIVAGERNRPDRLRNDVDDATIEQQHAAREESVRRFAEAGMPPADVAAQVVDAIRGERFYILTHPGIKANVGKRCEDIVEERVPEYMPLAL